MLVLLVLLLLEPVTVVSQHIILCQWEQRNKGQNLLILQQIRRNRASNRAHHTTQGACSTSMRQHGAHSTTSQRSAETTLTIGAYGTSWAALAWVLLMLCVSLLMAVALALTLAVALLALVVVLSLAILTILWLAVGRLGIVGRGSVSVGLVAVVL